jgi:hypothetical protein
MCSCATALNTYLPQGRRRVEECCETLYQTALQFDDSVKPRSLLGGRIGRVLEAHRPVGGQECRIYWSPADQVTRRLHLIRSAHGRAEVETDPAAEWIVSRIDERKIVLVGHMSDLEDPAAAGAAGRVHHDEVKFALLVFSETRNSQDCSIERLAAQNFLPVRGGGTP